MLIPQQNIDEIKHISHIWYEKAKELSEMGKFIKWDSARPFFNQEKITCVCRNSFEPDYIKDEEFINAIKENTEKRLKSTKAK